MFDASMWVHQPNHDRVELATLTALISPNKHRWSIYDLQGMVGVAPAGMSVESFERITKESNVGYEFEWPSLLRFARSLVDMYDCVLVATDLNRLLTRREIEAENWSNALLVLELFDSSHWVVHVRDEQSFPDLVATCKRLCKNI